jgi:hypothetical protein
MVKLNRCARFPISMPTKQGSEELREGGLLDLPLRASHRKVKAKVEVKGREYA